MSSGTNEDDIYKEIQDIVREETLFLRHYNGRVTNIVDPFRLGRVQVIIEELGFYLPSEGIWAHPRQPNALIIPKINDYVDVYFMNGDSGKPIYNCPCSEISNMNPTKYNGVVTDGVIFEHPAIPLMNIKIQSGTMIFLDGTESMVLGDSLKSDLQLIIDALTQLQTDFTSWTPVPNDGGQALKTLLTSGFLTKALPTLLQILSLLMKVK